MAICFLVGAVVGTALDGIHAYRDVLSYPDPAIGRWAWFVPVEFGLVGVLTGLAMPAVERHVARDQSIRWSPEERVGDLLLFPSLYLTTTLVGGGDAALWLLAALIGIAALRLILKPTAGDWIYVVAFAAIGPLAESLISATGAFAYAQPDLLHIPAWLPGLWANGAFFVRRLFRPFVMGP